MALRNLSTEPLTEPMAVSWHAVRLGSRSVADPAKADALVIGGGAIGMAAVLALKAQGISSVALVEPNASQVGPNQALVVTSHSRVTEYVELITALFR